MNSSNDNIVNLVDRLVEQKLIKIKEEKEDSKIKNKFKKILENIFVTLILTWIYCKFFRTPFISETVTSINIPTFTFNKFDIILPKMVKADILFLLKVENGTIIKEEHHNQVLIVFVESALKALGRYPLYINDNETFVVAFRIKEKNYSNLENKIVMFTHKIFSLNSKNEIDEGLQYLGFNLGNEIKFSNKREEIKAYHYDIQSHIIKDGDEIKEFPYIAENEKIRYSSWEKFDYYNFAVFFKKGHNLNQIEIKATSFYEIFFILLGSVEFVLDIIPQIIKFIKLRLNKKENIENNNSNRISLPMNEINNQNNSIINELNNQN